MMMMEENSVIFFLLYTRKTHTHTYTRLLSPLLGFGVFRLVASWGVGGFFIGTSGGL